MAARFEQTWDVLFDDQGRRMENVVFAPQSSLQLVSMSREDFEDIRNVLPFVLTSAEIPLYDVSYVGRQQEDELTTYVFDLQPKQMLPGKRYFEGRVWVDDHDFQIVKTKGRTVPQFKANGGKGGGKKVKAGQENLFPAFTTWREQIDGQYWFPTYTRADDTLHFSPATCASARPSSTPTTSASAPRCASPTKGKISRPRRRRAKADRTASRRRQSSFTFQVSRFTAASTQPRTWLGPRGWFG